MNIEKMVAEHVDVLGLQWVAGREGAMRKFASEGTATADLVGHLNAIHPGRVQVLGSQEINYLDNLTQVRRSSVLHELVDGNPPALIIAEGFVAPPELVDLCHQHQVPLLTCAHSAAHVIDVLRVFFSFAMAQTILMHGVFLDVFDIGVLITGESGLGKSELGLELITRGHGLVADDAVELSRVSPSIIEGRCPPLLQNMLEVRGIGLLDVRTLFGETSVRRRMRLRLIVHLVRRSQAENDLVGKTGYERIPFEAQYEEILGLKIRKVTLPVAAGRNLAVLIEAAVRNYILQLRGIDTLKQFMERQYEAMQHNDDSVHRGDEI